MILKFAGFIILLALIVGCSEKEISDVSNKMVVKPEQKEYKYIFGNRCEIEGDFDGDGKTDELIEHYFDAITKKEVSKFIEDMDDADRTTLISPQSFMLSTNSNIDTLHIASGGQVSGVLFIKNEGDLNGDNRDEISYVIHWADWSSLNKWHIITYRNNKWEDLITFPISEWQLDRLPEDNKSLVRRVSKNTIEVIFQNNEGEDETKRVTLN
jgi:hypothetical protein